MKLILENWQEFVNEEVNKDGKEQGVDGKACWDGYKYAGTEDGKDECVPMEEEREITSAGVRRDRDFSKAVMLRLKNGEISRKQAEEAYMKRGLKVPDTLKYLKNEETDPKPCKPSKGKRFAKRVDGKCRSYGQKGQAKGGGDRIRPGTKKGDAYCARSAKIKKCKNPPCANALSRKKWKCRGSKSMKE
tara:strand:+ start:330 stop:896 length:567 start_codon:yes stop_codon:yes gene_type:complete